ncbi:polycystin-1-like protein 3 [Ptychodera flava]|uniref:polycystin-1-like protein 3 n=1 Tax=Ptychodera flava TaxID=63121 RepID=UPI00396A3A8D
MFEIMAYKPFHAIQIMLASSHPVFENTTTYVLPELPRNASTLNDFQSSSEVILNGSYASVFLPEEEITKAGSFYVAFDLINSHGVEFRVSTTQHTCSYSDDNTYNWQNGGCKVSSKSNVNSTLCLCNHLTTFTAA